MDDSAAAGLQGGGPGITLNRGIEDSVRKDAVPFVIA
jgi:hypothetical protein